MANGYLAKRKFRENTLINSAQEMMVQYDVDTACRVLHRCFGFGEERLAVFLDAFVKLHGEDLDMFDPTYPEADYKREVMDRELRACVGSRFSPFDVRYPVARDIRYDKPIREKTHKPKKKGRR